MRNLYEVLGVSKNASEADIKKAYRGLAKKLHPDTNRGDTKIAERFKQVSSAHGILGDKGKRAQYDRGEIDADGNDVHRGFTGARPGGGRGQGGFGQFNFGGGPGDDIFRDIFGSMGGAAGQRGGRRPPTRGRDVAYRLSITFLEAALGATKRLTLGNGKTLDVKISVGIGAGQQIRLKKQGELGSPGAPLGDALVEFTIEPHEFFRRDGNDIFLDLPITIREAVLGAKVKVPTIHGQVTVTVPKGSNTGQTMRLKGKGIIPDGKGEKAGDQYLQLQVMLPEEVDEDLAKIVQEWSEDHAYEVRSKLDMT